MSVANDPPNISIAFTMGYVPVWIFSPAHCIEALCSKPKLVHDFGHGAQIIAAEDLECSTPVEDELRFRDNLEISSVHWKGQTHGMRGTRT